MRPPSSPPSAVASSSSAVRSRPSSSSGNPTSNSSGASRRQHGQQLPSSPTVTLFPDGATLVDDNARCGSDPDGTHKTHPKPPLRFFFSLRSLQLQWLLLRRRRIRNRGRPDDDEGGDCRRARRQFCGSRVAFVGIGGVSLGLWLLLVVFHPRRRPRGGWWEGRLWNSLASNRKEPWFRTNDKVTTTALRRLPPPYQVSPAVKQRNELYDPSRDPILSNLLGDEPVGSSNKQGGEGGVHSAAAVYQKAACRENDGNLLNRNQVPVRVLLLTKQRPRVYFRHPHDDNSSLMSDELLNIGQAGFRQSKCFRLQDFTIVPDLVLDDPRFELSHDLAVESAPGTTTSDGRFPVIPPAVWVVDMRRHSTVIQGGNYTILQELVILVKNTLRGVPQVDDYDHDNNLQHHNRRRPRHRRRLVVVLMDFRDYVPESNLCKSMAPLKELVQLLGPGHVRYVLQQTVKNRKWNYDANFVDLGNVYDPRPDAICWGGRALLQIPYTVRDDVADAVLQLASPPSSSGSGPSQGRSLPGPTFLGATSRPIDISHLWEIDDACRANKAVPRVRMQCELRNQVTQTLLDAFASTKYTVHTRIADSLGLRTVVQHEYVQTLVKSKIVVVSQRDLWEDSYRLMEALVSGALVMTDPMLTLPMGLVDRESIVIYQSLEDLVVLVMHYLENEGERLAIARRGFEVATTLHRPHHWMERLFFGTVVTP